MTIWAVANQKGGVGKTTTAVTLGGELAARACRTLLVDLDPHGSLTSYFGFDPESGEAGAYTLFQAQAAKSGPVDYDQVLRATAVEHLSVLPASTALATLDRQLGAREGMGLVIKHALDDLRDRFDYVLMDCPPMLGVLMVNALAACDHLLIPVQTEFLAMKGLERMLRTLDMMHKSRAGGIPHTIIPTMFDRRTRASGDALAALQERYGTRLWDQVIPVDTQFREASKAGRPLSLFKASARGARAYQALLRSLLGEPQELAIAQAAELEQVSVR